MRDQQGRFKPGTSGNPSGRPPKEITFTEIMREKLSDQDAKTQRTRIENIIEMLISAAENGDVKAAEIIMNRVDGKPIATVREVPIERDELIEI